MKDIQMIKAEQLFHHPNNPRKDLGDLTELTESIRKNGIMQNLTVVPYVRESVASGKPAYWVVIGNRRLEAGKLAGLEEFPCVISEMSEREQLATMLEENMQRADLTYYEQAQGFQLMLDLGDTVEGIAEKTGFTTKTVKKRLELVKLDPELLKDACARQISMADLDELTQISDPKLRNLAMGSIGTDQFRYKVKRIALKEKADAALPKVEKILKKIKAEKITNSERWNGKYNSFADLHISDATESDFESKEKVFYYIDPDNDKLELFHQNENAKPIKKSKKEIKREEYIKDTWAEIDRLAKITFELRRDFVMGLKMTKSNTPLLLSLAMQQCIFNHFKGTSYDRFDDLKNAVLAKGEPQPMAGEMHHRILSKFMKDPASMTPRIIWNMTSDTPEKNCTGWSSRNRFPEYSENPVLNFIYFILESLGYEKSEEERMILDGTHPVYKDKDKKEDPVEPELVEDDPEEEQDEDELLDEGVSEALEEIYDDADSGEKSVGKNDE